MTNNHIRELNMVTDQRRQQTADDLRKENIDKFNANLQTNERINN